MERKEEKNPFFFNIFFWKKNAKKAIKTSQSGVWAMGRPQNRKQEIFFGQPCIHWHIAMSGLDIIFCELVLVGKCISISTCPHYLFKHAPNIKCYPSHTCSAGQVTVTFYLLHQKIILAPYKSKCEALILCTSMLCMIYMIHHSLSALSDFAHGEYVSLFLLKHISLLVFQQSLIV